MYFNISSIRADHIDILSISSRSWTDFSRLIRIIVGGCSFAQLKEETNEAKIKSLSQIKIKKIFC